MFKSLQRALAGALCGLLLTATTAAWSQAAYPNRPVRLIVPFPPGGGADALGRLLGTRLATRLGQPVVIENHAGANGTIGTTTLARATPDGYTIGLITATMTVSDAVGGNAYDINKDLEGVVFLASSPMLITVNASSPATDLKDLIARARANPGKLNFGSSGLGGIGHVTGELFKLRTGVDMVHVPYAGGGPLMLALLSGQVDVIFADAPPALPQLRAGKVRVLAVSAPTRSPTFPDTPSAPEAAGIQDFESMAWYAVAAPAGTPKDLVQRLNTEFNALLAQADVREALKTLALDPRGGGPEVVGAVTRREVAEWKNVVRKVGLTKQ